MDPSEPAHPPAALPAADVEPEPPQGEVALGNVFEGLPATGQGDGGRDVHLRVEVSRADLGAPAGAAVCVPSEVEQHGERVQRAVPSEGPRDRIRLHLPENWPSGGTVRLRGQGGVSPGGSAGDLYLEVHVTERKRGLWWLALVLLLAAVTGVAARLWQSW